jgi:hypothetical protein
MLLVRSNKGLVIIYQGGWGGVIQNFKE